MKIAIIGLGLIGGSFAKALSAKTGHAVYGFDRDEDVCAQALRERSVRGILQPEFLDEYELILVCLHPRAAVSFVLEHLEQLAPGSIVADVCGVKREICGKIEAPLRERGVSYVGTHPMAGREFSGYSASTDSLFDEASMILTQTEVTDQTALLRLHALSMELGFTRVVICSPEEHDRIIACTSQMAHVISSAYVKSRTASAYQGFTAGSFQDMTRVARLDENMWTELFLANREALTCELEQMIGRLKEYAEALERRDESRLRQLLCEGRLRKEELDRHGLHGTS